MPKKLCEVCGQEFMARLSVYRTCGVVCRNRLVAAEKEARHTTTQPCPVCGKEFSKSGKKKAQQTCSAGCGRKLAGRLNERKVERVCKTCGATFLAVPSADGSYCSKKCLYARNDTTRHCEHCGKSFRAPPSHEHVRTCSTECGYAIRETHDQRVELICKHCGKKFLESPSRSDSRVYCSKKCQNTDPETIERMRIRISGEQNPGWLGGVCVKTVSASGREYSRQQPHKENARGTKRRALKIQATVAWADQSKIDRLYAEAQRLSELTGMIYHVDHIVPLNSAIVSGLHNEFNLQLLPGQDNLRKGNRHWPDMP